jgi:hypothetical protein
LLNRYGASAADERRSGYAGPSLPYWGKA